MTTPDQHSDLDGTRRDPAGSRNDPRGTDSRGTDPRGADPRGTDPRGTDPHGTDPRGSDPRGADEFGTGAGQPVTEHRGGTVHDDPRPVGEQAGDRRVESRPDRPEPGTEHAAGGPADPAGSAAAARTDAGNAHHRNGDAEPHNEALVPADRAGSYTSRWDAVKGTFVDEPRQAVAQADELVGELLRELEGLFREQRRSIEQGFANDETSTEDLRVALRRYRSFFDRLLTL